jgi:L-seryl-tRNA(Ser) seleniumtransferase
VPDIYDRLGVTPIINCATTYTRLGGSIMAPEVARAMAEAAPAFVDVHELQVAVGRRLAELTGNEAAYVSNGAAAGIAIATSAAVCGDDLGRMSRLPHLGEVRDQVVVHRTQRLWYDHAVRQIGVELVEIGHAYETQPWELDDAITDRTAAVVYFAGSHLNRNTLSLPYVVERAHVRGVPVIVDAAAQLPPVSNLWRFTRECGADVAVFSGGKTIGGPQNSGLAVGTSEMIRLMRLNGPPNQRLTRTMKVAKETMVGLLTAVERYVGLDHDAVLAGWDEVVDGWVAAWANLPCEVVRSATGEAGESIPRVILRMATPVDRDEFIAALRAGSPPIEVVHEDERSVALSPHLLQEGQAEIVAERVLHEMAAVGVGQPARLA